MIRSIHGTRVGLVILLAGLLGCATVPAGERRDPRAPITAEELDMASVPTAWEAVRLLRPSWVARLNGVYLDGVRSSRSALEEMSVMDVGEIRLITASDATARYGARALSGYCLDVKRRR